MKLKDYNINGIIDRLDKVNDNFYRIIDYKTGTFEYKEVTKSIQFVIYALEVFANFPECNLIEVVYENISYKTSANGVVRRSEIPILENKILSYIEAIDNDKEYSTRLSYDCLYCEFNNMCKEFNDWITMEGKIEKSKEAIGNKFLEYRVKAKYYNDLLEKTKNILHLYGEGEIEMENEIINVTDGRINVRRK